MDERQEQTGTGMRFCHIYIVTIPNIMDEGWFHHINDKPQHILLY